MLLFPKWLPHSEACLRISLSVPLGLEYTLRQPQSVDLRCDTQFVYQNLKRSNPFLMRMLIVKNAEGHLALLSLDIDCKLRRQRVQGQPEVDKFDSIAVESV